ncbi:right-handed parallel beta-helix repeat-containing protein [Jannaschia sp. 2305UL9-9]|uniref:right-handed parallel beta-helix repeat-containing protein n=1 Tax=Jannaschia sp. 2305UL9-9 TaxID=3121638 RepID=UPI00352770D4
MISPSLAEPEPAEVVDPMAPPSYDRATAARIAGISRALSQGGDVSVDEIRAAAGLAPRAASVTGFRQQMILPPAQPSVFNLRLALTMLSQGRQRQDDERVRLAQGTRGDTALAFSGGLVTLATLRDAMTRTGMQTDPSGPLRIPVVLLEDTVLRLSPGDVIEMSRTDGAFIMSFGRVEIDGATLRTVGELNTTIQSYRPFIVVAGTGSMTMRDATIEGLGFGDTAKYSGVSVLGHPLRPMDGVTEILDSRMSDVLSLSLTAVNGARVTGNRFADMRSAAVRMSASPRSAVSDNIFHGAGPTNAIRVLDRSDNVSLTGNILLSGERAGIVVRRSHAAMVASNVVWGRDGGGIKLQETTCGVIADNTLLDSRQKGIEIRASMAATVRNNLIAGNRSAGIWISAQANDAMTEITANRLSGNGAGLVGATAASVSLVSNDLTAQMPRLADGDLTDASAAIAGDLTGDAPMLLTGAGAIAPAILTCEGDEA